eukprot:6951520-Pyramimonas_sp.AAC.1
MAAMPLVSVTRSGGHRALVGDPRQLPPTVLSRKAADRGLCLSIFDKLRSALGGGSPAVVQLNLCYRMHPLILSWPNVAFYNKASYSVWAHRPPGAEADRGRNAAAAGATLGRRRLQALAASANTTTDDME